MKAKTILLKILNNEPYLNSEIHEAIVELEELEELEKYTTSKETKKTCYEGIYTMYDR